VVPGLSHQTYVSFRGFQLHLWVITSLSVLRTVLMHSPDLFHSLGLSRRNKQLGSHSGHTVRLAVWFIFLPFSLFRRLLTFPLSFYFHFSLRNLFYSHAILTSFAFGSFWLFLFPLILGANATEDPRCVAWDNEFRCLLGMFFFSLYPTLSIFDLYFSVSLTLSTLVFITGPTHYCFLFGLPSSFDSIFALVSASWMLPSRRTLCICCRWSRF